MSLELIRFCLDLSDEDETTTREGQEWSAGFEMGATSGPMDIPVDFEFNDLLDQNLGLEEYMSIHSDDYRF